MAKLPTFSNGLPMARQTVAPLIPKVAHPKYGTPEHRAWSKQVIERAGGRCEWVENGIRCERARPQHRMHADHPVEIADGGSWQGQQGQCLCTQHNTLKAAQARAARLARGVGSKT